MSKLRILERERRKPKRMPFKERGKILAIVKSILEKEGYVRLVVIHGGFLNSEVFRDIDVAVYMDRRSDSNCELVYIEELRDRLEKATGIGIDIQLLNEASPSFIHRVLSKGKVIMEKNVGTISILRIHALEEMRRLKKGGTS